MVKPLEEVSVKYVRSVDDLQAFLTWLSEDRPWLAVDTETSGFDWWRGDLRLCQVGDREAAWCFDWRWWAGAVKQGLTAYDRPMVYHNAKFDLHWLEQQDTFAPRWPLVHDTQVMVSLVDGGRPSGLKPAAARYVHPGAARGERMLKDGMAQHGWGWDTVPVDFPPYWGYGGLDAILTARLAEALWPDIQAKYADLYELERASMAVIYEMEKRGARIDPGYVAVKRKQLQREVSQLKAWGETEHKIAIGSPTQLVDRFTQLGVELTKRTESGKFSTDSLVLKSLTLHDNGKVADLATNALRQRKASKTESAYFRNFEEMADDRYRLHPSIRQMGARTGRMSVASPSLQNVTRGPEVRDAFIASEGCQLVLSDYDQIEMRLLYHYCRDPSLFEAIMSGDLHTTTAQRVYQDPTITKDSPERQPAKSVGFAKIYGAGIDQMAATAGIPVDAARSFMEQYDQMFPGVQQFIDRVKETGQQRLNSGQQAFVTTDGGRRQVCESDKLFRLTNYLIQGTAADVLKRQMVHLDAAGLGDYMILPVHDELILDVPEEEVDAVKRVIDEVMPVPAERFGVPLTIGTDVYDRWGSKYRAAGEEFDDPIEPNDLHRGEEW